MSDINYVGRWRRVMTHVADGGDGTAVIHMTDRAWCFRLLVSRCEYPTDKHRANRVFFSLQIRSTRNRIRQFKFYSPMTDRGSLKMDK